MEQHELKVIQDEYSQFDSFDSFLRYVESLPSHDAFNSAKRPASDFHANTTWEETLTLARYGWSEGTKKLQNAMPQMPERNSLKMFQNVCGIMPIVPAYCSGVPTNMIDVRRVKKATNHIKIYVQTSYNYKCTESQIVTHGASIVSFINALEQKDISCDVIALNESYTEKNKNNKKGNLARLEVPLKTAGQPLDLDRFAFCLMHPCYQRRLKFQWIERELYNFGQFPENRGIPNHFESDTKDGFVVSGLKHDDNQTVTEKIDALENQFAQYIQEQ